MTEATGDTIANAVHQNRALSGEGMLERLFARLFRGLVYPQIWEDPVCDMAALEVSSDDDIVCIASGGCNMMSYLTAAPASITAVDLSPWHVELGRLKLLAADALEQEEFYAFFGDANRPGNVALFDAKLAPKLEAGALAFWNERTPLRMRKSLFGRGFYRFGVLGRFLGAIHLVARLARVDFAPLLDAKSQREQQAFFDSKIAPLYQTRFVKFLARRRASLFGLGIPPAQYDKLAADGGGDVIPVLNERTRKLFCDFPISENYFAWQAANRGYKADGSGPVPPYLEAENFPEVKRNSARATVENRSVTDVLREAPAASKSVYILLDAQDWMNDQQLNDLWQQITRTARSGARVLFRTGGAKDILPGRVAEDVLEQWVYDHKASKTAFETDRSAIYGGVHLYRLKV